MSEFNYDIVMETSLGQRCGKMMLIINGTKIDGFLNILGNKSPVHGELDDYGGCVLLGSIKTLVRTIEYVATGSADEKKINLTLCGQRDVFHVNGIACTSGRTRII